MRFVTSAATTDFLYYDDRGAQVTVSNSLPLLLAYFRDALDPHYPDYPLICESVMDGIDDYRRDIPTKRGNVRRQMFRNLEVSREDLGIRKEDAAPIRAVLRNTGTTWKTSTDSLRPMREMVHVPSRWRYARRSRQGMTPPP